jgi:hypothetical protein
LCNHMIAESAMIGKVHICLSSYKLSQKGKKLSSTQGLIRSLQDKRQHCNFTEARSNTHWGVSGVDEEEILQFNEEIKDQLVECLTLEGRVLCIVSQESRCALSVIPGKLCKVIDNCT